MQIYRPNRGLLYVYTRVFQFTDARRADVGEPSKVKNVIRRV